MEASAGFCSLLRALRGAAGPSSLSTSGASCAMGPASGVGPCSAHRPMSRCSSISIL